MGTKKKGKKVRRTVSQSRYKTAYKEKDKGGVSRQSLFDFKKAGYDNIKYCKLKEKVNRLIFIPYEIKSKNHPLVRAGKAEIGELDYIMDIWAHTYVGPNKADIVCPKKNYGKPCPICDRADALYNDGDKEGANQIKASRRAFYNVLPVVKGEIAEDLELLHVSHYLFEKEMIEEANECSDGDDIINFSDIEEGSIIKFRKSTSKKGQYETPEFKSFSFEDREEELDDGLIDEAISFDEALIILTPDEIEAIYMGDDDEEEEEQPKKKGKKSSKKKTKKEEEEEEDDDDDDSEEDSEEEEDDDDDDDDSEEDSEEEDDDDDEEEEEDDEEEEPVKKPKKPSTTKKVTAKKSSSKKKSSKKEEFDDTDEDGNIDGVPRMTTDQKKLADKKKSKKKSSKKAEDECPKGHEFGTDCDSFRTDCSRCKIWEACSDRQDELEEDE